MSIDMERLRALKDRAELALAFWGLGAQEPQLLKYRENAVFRVRLANGAPAALRLHRPGYNTDAAIRSELSFSAYLAEAGMTVPQPIPTKDGDLLASIGGQRSGAEQFASLVSWIDGEPLGQSGVPLRLDPSASCDVFERLGKVLATLHTLADDFTPQPGFDRPSWDTEGLLGDSPLWGHFWDCAGLGDRQRQDLIRLRHSLRERVTEPDFRALDFGLIHADAVRENIMLVDGSIGLIDLDDFGYGYRLFELATTLLRNRAERHYDDLQAALLHGYGSSRALPSNVASLLAVVLILRCLTYIGWAAQRRDVAWKVPLYADEALALSRQLGQSADLTQS